MSVSYTHPTTTSYTRTFTPYNVGTYTPYVSTYQPEEKEIVVETTNLESSQVFNEFTNTELDPSKLSAEARKILGLCGETGGNKQIRCEEEYAEALNELD